MSGHAENNDELLRLQIAMNTKIVFLIHGALSQQVAEHFVSSLRKGIKKPA